jgi:hypothetical protein
MNAVRKTLYELLPAYVRRRDQETDHALEQLLGIVDAQALAIERDLQRMYDNWFIETCDPWVVPYIGDLLGHPSSPGVAGSAALAGIMAPRREIANAIAHGRRKGARSLLESLAMDVAGWPAVAVEFYRLMVGAQHLDHPQPTRVVTVDLRDARALERIGTPFDGVCQLADTHRIGNAGSRGTHNLPHVGVFVFRMRSYGVDQTWAYCQEEVGAHCYTFSLLGNDAPLYRSGDPTRAPLPIGRRELEEGDAEDASAAQAMSSLVGPHGSFSITAMGWPKKDVDTQIDAASIIPADLEGWAYKVPKGKVAVDPVRGRLMFATGQTPRKGVRVSYRYGFAMDLGGGDYDRPPMPMPAEVERAVVRASEHGKPGEGEFASIAAAVEDWQRRRAQPELPLPATDGAPALVTPHPALVVELADSGVYRGRLDLSLGRGESVWLIAAPRTRPVLWLSDDSAGGPDAIAIRGAAGSRFTLDGVMVAGRGISISPLPIDQDDARIDGSATTPVDDLCRVLIRHSTLVPGWGLDCDCEPRRASEPSIVMDGSKACLRIEHSIVGAIQVQADDGDAPPANIAVADSIIDAHALDREAIGDGNDGIAPARLTVLRSTVVGAIAVHSIALGEDSLLLGHVQVARRQVGCIRYCYVAEGSRTPRRHRCQPDDAARAATDGVDNDPAIADGDRAIRRAHAQRDAVLRVWPDFESMRYGKPDYLRLRPCTAVEIARGTHDTSEMGVYHDLFEPQRIDLLDARVADHVPAGFESCILLAS